MRRKKKIIPKIINIEIQKLIDAIVKLDPGLDKLIDLTKYSKEQLELHLKKLRDKL